VDLLDDVAVATVAAAAVSANDDDDDDDDDANAKRRQRRRKRGDRGGGGANEGRGRVSENTTTVAARRKEDEFEEIEFDRGDGEGHDGHDGDGGVCDVAHDGGGAGGKMEMGEGGYAATAYYPSIMEADAEVMAEINQEGLVHIDESGGIQAFVAETIAIDGDAVGIIKSDAEVEREEKRRYTKLFCGAVVALVVVILAVAVPLTLKFAGGNETTILTVITESPTDFPSN